MNLDSKHKEGDRQHQLIIAEAEGRGISVEEVSTDNESVHRLTLGDQTEMISSGIPLSWINEKAESACDNKIQTKVMFGQIGIPSPLSFAFQNVDQLSDELFAALTTYVCKPQVGTNGQGVRFDIRSKRDVADYLNDFGSGDYLIEEFAAGEDLRIQVIGGEIAAACIRKPAYVTGDGKRSMSELIDARRKEIQEKNPSNRLDIEETTNEMIANSNYDMDSVVKGCEIVPIKRIANMGQGAIAYDVTRSIDPKFQGWVDDLVGFLGTDYFALDVNSRDPSDINSAVALEVNLRAEWLHHTFAEGKKYDLAKVVLDELFH